MNVEKELIGFGSEDWPERGEGKRTWEEILMATDVFECESVSDIKDDFLRSKLSSDHPDAFKFQNGTWKVYHFFIDDADECVEVPVGDYASIDLERSMRDFVNYAWDDSWDMSKDEVDLLFERMRLYI